MWMFIRVLCFIFGIFQKLIIAIVCGWDDLVSIINILTSHRHVMVKLVSLKVTRNEMITSFIWSSLKMSWFYFWSLILEILRINTTFAALFLYAGLGRNKSIIAFPVIQFIWLWFDWCFSSMLVLFLSREKKASNQKHIQDFANASNNKYIHKIGTHTKFSTNKLANKLSDTNLWWIFKLEWYFFLYLLVCIFVLKLN